jgi:hypothetical protein
MESTAEIPPLREVVAHAWFTMGYPPSRSLVLVEMIHVDGGDVPGFVARIDLPPPRYRRQAAEVIATVARRNQVEAALVLVVLDPVPSRRPMAPDRMKRMVRDLRSVLRRARVSVLDVVLVDAGRSRSLLCDDETCCPVEGEELGDLAATRTAAAMVLSGRALVEDESALVADVTPDPWPPEVLAADEPGGDPDELLSRWQALVAARSRTPAEPPTRPRRRSRGWSARWRTGTCATHSSSASCPAACGSPAGSPRGQVLGVPDLGASEARRPDPALFEAGRALLAAVARGAPPAAVPTPWPCSAG